jgi:hypothetical protein
MIAKTFVIAKTFSSHSANFFRQDKRLRDHDNAAGRPMRSDVTHVCWRITSPRSKLALGERRPNLQR